MNCIRDLAAKTARPDLKESAESAARPELKVPRVIAVLSVFKVFPALS